MDLASTYRESTHRARHARHAQALLLYQPALASDARNARTLRLLGGLEVPEIARAHLIREATVAQRIVRARKKIRDAASRAGYQPNTNCRTGCHPCSPCSTCGTSDGTSVRPARHRRC
jgi:DNA-directed RNA polymerase specialized sigma24 family protein